jgi:glycosyltransferase involved in cell wall biosynthesis
MIDPEQPDYASTPAADDRPRFGYALADAGCEPVLTIVTPFFNTGALFHATARSVMRQSLQQWEWLIVNDASTDRAALDVLAQYRHSDARIRVIDVAVNGGPGRARNIGYAQARAPYVLQLDSDNLLEPTAAEKWWWYLETHPRAGFVKGYSVGFGAQTYLWRSGFHTPELFLTSNPVDATSLVRVAVHRRAGGYDESMREGLEDWDFWLRCAAAREWGGTVPEFLDWYRRREDHNDRWPAWDGGARQKAFVRSVRANYPDVRAGHFPDVAPPAPTPNATITGSPPAMNQLARSGSRALLIVPWMAVGGSDKFNLDVVDALTRRGWEISIAATGRDSAWLPLFARLTPDIFVLPEFLSPADYPQFLLYLVQSRRPDVVVVSHSELGYHLLPFLRAHAPDVTFVDYCHVVEESWNDGGYPRLSIQYRQFLDLSIVSSRHLQTWMVDQGADTDRIAVCYTGGPTVNDADRAASRARCRQQLGVDERTAIVLYPARLCAQKQPRVFAQAMRILAEEGLAFVSVVAGSGPERAWLGTYVKGARLTSRVRLLDAVAPKRMAELMAGADICFLPSTHEGIALTLYEAMAAGAVFVGADVGGQREVLTEDCGFLLPRLQDEAGEAAAYAGVLSRLLRDPEARGAFAATARRRITDGFTNGRMADALEASFTTASRLHHEAARPAVDLAVGDLMATRAIEHHRVTSIAEALWSQASGGVTAGGGWRLWVFRQCTWLEPAYAWGVRRGWQWLPAARARIRSALAS